MHCYYVCRCCEADCLVVCVARLYLFLLFDLCLFHVKECQRHERYGWLQNDGCEKSVSKSRLNNHTTGCLARKACPLRGVLFSSFSFEILHATNHEPSHVINLCIGQYTIIYMYVCTNMHIQLLPITVVANILSPQNIANMFC